MTILTAALTLPSTGARPRLIPPNPDIQSAVEETLATPEADAVEALDKADEQLEKAQSQIEKQAAEAEAQAAQAEAQAKLDAAKHELETAETERLVGMAGRAMGRT